jgi:hypothetical protein
MCQALERSSSRGRIGHDVSVKRLLRLSGPAALGVAVAALVIVPAIASAAGSDPTVWVSPHGSGSACIKAKPCGIEDGFQKLVTGTLILTPGSYGSASSRINQLLSAGKNTLVEGEPGKKAPTIYTGDFVSVWSVSHVDVNYVGSDNGAVLIYHSMDHSSVTAMTSTFQGAACASFGAAITDSVCYDTGSQGVALSVDAGTETVPIRGVTAIGSAATGTGILASEGTTNTVGHVTVSNSIAIGAEDLGGINAAQGSDPTAIVIVTVSHSDASQTESNNQSTVNTDDTDTDQPPVFADATDGNFTEEPSSPTIDTGAKDPAHDTDLAGRPRTLGKAPDMGAYEVPEQPTITKIKVKRRTSSSLTVRVTIDAEGLTSHVGVTATKGLSAQLSRQMPVTGDKPTTVKLTITGLKHKSSYVVQAEASNAAGSVNSPKVKAHT